MAAPSRLRLTLSERDICTKYITAGQTTATHLLDAFLHQILNPVGQGKP